VVALNVQAMRMARVEDGPFAARATVVHAGRTFVRVAAGVTDAAGRAVGQATAALAVEPDAVPTAALASGVTVPRYEGPDPHEQPVPPGELDMRVWRDRRPLDVLQAISAGELPHDNSSQLLGMRWLDVAEGSMTLSLPASPWFALQDDTVDPAILNLLAASASGGATYTLGTETRLAGELNRSLAFERPIPADGRQILARGNTRVRGGRIVVCDVEISDPDGNVAALEQALWLLVDRRDERTAAAASQRTLATVMFTDIVASTEHASAIGDVRWGEKLAEHHALVRQQLAIFRGHEVKTTGDGFLVTFDSPARAVQCARAIRDRIQASGMQIRAGLHAGELEVTGEDIAGIAVHIASRILAACGPNQILVSGTVHDLTVGSGLRLEDRGPHSLKGIEGEWRLFAARG
jgi:class 3 adenylate cyclase